MSERTLNLIKDNDIRWVDLRFTDTRGKEQHVSIPARQVDEDCFEDGKYVRRAAADADRPCQGLRCHDGNGKGRHCHRIVR